MKNKTLLIIGILITHAAYGETCTQVSCPSGTIVDGTEIGDITGCATYHIICHKGTTSTIYSSIVTCDTCSSGYTRTTYSSLYSTSLLNGLSAGSGRCTGWSPSGDTAIYTCCKGCTSCTNDTTWKAGNTGYQKKAIRSCNCNTCEETSAQYRCAAGYYGSSTNGTSGCTKCSSPTGNSAATSEAGSTSITDCYLPSGTEFSDTTGNGTYTSTCYWK